MARLFVTLFILCLLRPAVAADIDTGSHELDTAFNLLLDRDFARKAEGVELLSQSTHEQATELLNGLLEGKLRYLKKPGKLVWLAEQDGTTVAIDVMSGESLGKTAKRKFKRFTINNELRGRIRSLLAKNDLGSPDPQVRLAAVRRMLDTVDSEQTLLLQQLLEKETDPDVQGALQTAIALADLNAPGPAKRLQAIAGLEDSLEPAVRNSLARLVGDDADDAVRAAAGKAIKRIEQRVEMYGNIETLFFGLSLGSVLVLAAIGLAITFGVMGVINMAHGELIMLGAYTTYLLQQAMPGMTGVSILLAIPAAFLVSGLAGIAIERGVIRHLYGRPLETLLATFGISLVLQQLVRTLISPQNVPVSNPDFLSGFWQINSVLSLTYNRLYIFVFCLLVFAGLFFVLKYTRLGLQVRAVSQNRAMARAMGVRSARVDALTFGLGSGIAGVAGVALSQLTNVGPNLGQAYIVDSFMVVVFGGVGNLWGTLIGGLGLGIANKVMEPWAGAVLAKILVLVFIILFIQKRPRGLFPQKGRAAES